LPLTVDDYMPRKRLAERKLEDSSCRWPGGALELRAFIRSIAGAEINSSAPPLGEPAPNQDQGGAVPAKSCGHPKLGGDKPGPGFTGCSNDDRVRQMGGTPSS